MRDVLKKNKIRLIAGFLLSVIVLFANVTGYADEKQIAATQEQKKEIFIGRFKGDVSVMWCGNDALVVSSREMGIEWIDIQSKKTMKISSRTFPDKYDYPLNCTPDGRWVVYVDTKSSREDKGYKPEYFDDFGWDGGVVDLYRYDVTTGKKQKFAVIRYLGPFEAVSPDGTKIFLGGRHNSSIPMPEPKWNAVWFKNYDWGQTHAKWLLDSSGVIISENGPNGVGIEFFGKNGWAKMFEWTQFRGNIAVIGVDRENRFYVSEDDILKKRRPLYLCIIKNKNLSCKKIIEGNRVTSYRILPAGDIVFVEAGGSCIRRVRVGQTEAKCIVEKGGDYDFIRIGAVSPDGQKLAFIQNKVAKSLKGGSFVSQSDLFVINLEN